jgi:glycosyltransferase involved in cell wall biosynthesis
VSRFEDVGVVVIARNEGERLLRCLDSLAGRTGPVVYADSASGDGSPERVRARGIEVVELDPDGPMNAALGRNAGFARLQELGPDLEYVLFLDGDCELVEGFLAAARAALEGDPRLAAVCGRRRERHPEASPYNRIVDMEWNTPVGPAEAFGGDVLMRVRALAEVGGYDGRMNQGEDPETAYRLRRAGWGLLRIAHDMTWHDVGLARLTSWWRRHGRGGEAYVHGALLHRGDGGRYNQRAIRSILFWGLGLPLVALLAAWPTSGASAVLLAGYPLLWWRLRGWRRRLGDSGADASLYATFITLGKLAEALGVVRGAWSLWRGQGARSVEYKDYQRSAA